MKSHLQPVGRLKSRMIMYKSKHRFSRSGHVSRLEVLSGRAAEDTSHAVSTETPRPPVTRPHPLDLLIPVPCSSSAVLPVRTI
jgi:hypothetical protein